MSIIDVHLDSVSRDKLIFPSAITRILRHFSIPFPSSNHFTVMCAIDYATIKRSEAQFRSRQTDSAAPSSRSAPSQSTPFAFAPSFSGDVSLGDVMAQLQRMDAHLDTLSTKLYQVNVHVGHIVWRQATIGDFAPEPTPSPPHPVASDSDDDDDNGDGDDDDASDGDDDDASDDDGDAISTDEMST